MNKGLRQRTISRPETIKPGDILNFSSAIIALISTGIFYFAGWVYVSHWYGYFGIDTSQLELPVHLILIHGIPGVLILAFTALISIAFFSIWKHRVKKTVPDMGDVPIIVLIAYLLAIIVLLLLISLYFPRVMIAVNLFQLIPFEVSISLVGVILMIGLLYYNLSSIFAQILVNSRQEDHSTSDVQGSGKPTPQKSVVALYESIRFTLNEKDKIGKVIKSYALNETILQTWQFWLGTMLLLYFLISISTSAILGEWDAKQGKKSMVGGWQAEAAYFFSSNKIPSLPLSLTKTSSNTGVYVYGPFMILGKNGNTYYLTDWTNTFPYTQKPNVYVASIPESNFLGVQMIAPTPIPIAVGKAFATPLVTITPSPTLTPSQTITVTATP